MDQNRPLQAKILTAERSILGGPKKPVISGRFALRFQSKSLVHFCATDGLQARLVLGGIFSVFITKTRVLGMTILST